MIIRIINSEKGIIILTSYCNMKEYTISNGFCMALGGFVNRNKKDSLSLLMVSWFKSPPLKYLTNI